MFVFFLLTLRASFLCVPEETAGPMVVDSKAVEWSWSHRSDEFSAQEEEAECEQDYADGDGDDSGWVSRQR